MWDTFFSSMIPSNQQHNSGPRYCPDHKSMQKQVRLASECLAAERHCIIEGAIRGPGPMSPQLAGQGLAFARRKQRKNESGGA
jgi:hypothetical protein